MVHRDRLVLAVVTAVWLVAGAPPAIGQVSGEVDQVHTLEGTSRADVLARARDDAAARAIAAGADPATIELVDAEDVPLAYLPGSATRVRVKVVGQLRDEGRGADVGG